MLIFGRKKNKEEIVYQDLEQIKKLYPNADVDSLTVGLPSAGKSFYKIMRAKSETEITVDEIKVQIKDDLDIYKSDCLLLQIKSEGYDHMVLENMIEQIEHLKREVDKFM